VTITSGSPITEVPEDVAVEAWTVHGARLGRERERTADLDGRVGPRWGWTVRGVLQPAMEK
jgi:hypothetical protein